MASRILLNVQNKLIKGIVYRFLLEAGYEVVEVMDRNDLRFKLDVYSFQFLLYVLEVPEANQDIVFAEVSQMRLDPDFKRIPILALIPKDTSDYVSTAIKSGIEDLLLLPRPKETYRSAITEKLQAILTKLNPEPNDNELEAQNILQSMESESIKEKLEADLRHAARGKYPLSLLMIRFSGVEIEKTEKFIDRLKSLLRETDIVWRFTPNTWLVSCPFTEKSSIIEVERKVFSTFELEVEQQGRHKRINLFTATYPTDEDSLDGLLQRLMNGIRNSMAISSITTPLNAMSRVELESFKKKIHQYRKYF